MYMVSVLTNKTNVTNLEKIKRDLPPIIFFFFFTNS